uniref:Secreted protein n=1 Tax=Rhizophora mucronata TaxID=61149 RepID=A0A2P2JKL2_RHIMU
MLKSLGFLIFSISLFSRVQEFESLPYFLFLSSSRGHFHWHLCCGQIFNNFICSGWVEAEVSKHGSIWCYCNFFQFLVFVFHV